jgi:hypothetical protein
MSIDELKMKLLQERRLAMGAEGLEDIGDVGDIEIIEVEMPLEPVPMQDCCLQVRSTSNLQRKERFIAF